MFSFLFFVRTESHVSTSPQNAANENDCFSISFSSLLFSPSGLTVCASRRLSPPPILSCTAALISTPRSEVLPRTTALHFSSLLFLFS